MNPIKAWPSAERIPHAGNSSPLIYSNASADSALVRASECASEQSTQRVLPVRRHARHRAHTQIKPQQEGHPLLGNHDCRLGARGVEHGAGAAQTQGRHPPQRPGQYTSLAFGERCRQMQVRPSMGTVGDAYDNAMAESFFASLEGELIERSTFQSKAQARMEVFTWIEGWYNPRRRHSGLGYHSPLNFERSHEALFDVVDDADVHPETTPETV